MVTAPGRHGRPGAGGSQAGQGLVEYGLILTLVVVVAIASLVLFGSAVSGLLSSIGTSI
jgi:Flp pilus assembly pilin Flp